MSAINMDEVTMDAMRQIRAEQEAERRAALQEKLRLEREMADLHARERDARIAFEAEQIEARRRAEEALLAAKARAEKEMYDAAVRAKMEELRNRSPIEKLQAEIEELRAELLAAKPWSAPLQEVRAQVSACPWNTDIGGLRAQMDDLKKSVAEVKSLYQKPARQVSVFFSSGFGHTASINGASAMSSPTLNLQYYIVPQNCYTAQGTPATVSVSDQGYTTIRVPEGHKVLVGSARTTVTVAQNSSIPSMGHKPLDWRDLTHLYKGLLETQ